MEGVDSLNEMEKASALYVLLTKFISWRKFDHEMEEARLQLSLLVWGRSLSHGGKSLPCTQLHISERKNS